MQTREIQRMCCHFLRSYALVFGVEVTTHPRARPSPLYGGVGQIRHWHFRRGNLVWTLVLHTDIGPE